jgi:flagellar biosynthesis/type III secretory pathway chaperone
MDATVEKSCQKLIGNLEDITKLYRQLLDIVRKEKEYLLSADRDKIEETNALKESYLMKLRLAEVSRIRCASDLALLIGCDAEAPRLLDLSKKLGGEFGEKLRIQHSALDAIIRRITDLNRENEEHVQSALRTLNGAMTEIKGTISGKTTYEKKGQHKLGPQVAGNFVSKEA